MATLVPQAIEELYQEFKEQDLSINKDVIQVTGLLPTDIILKCTDYQWPCVIYSCSFLYAKLIMSLTEEMTHIMKKANNSASLRFAFNPHNSKERLRFFVPGKIKGTKSFKIKEKMAFLVNFEYNGKPPDDLIELFGIVYQTKKFYNMRKDHRIPQGGKGGVRSAGGHSAQYGGQVSDRLGHQRSGGICAHGQPHPQA